MFIFMFLFQDNVIVYNVFMYVSFSGMFNVMLNKQNVLSVAPSQALCGGKRSIKIVPHKLPYG